MEAENEATLLADLKVTLGDECAAVSDDILLMFVRWKRDVARAAERYRAHVEWRKSATWMEVTMLILLYTHTRAYGI